MTLFPRLLLGLVVLICAEVFSGTSVQTDLWSPWTWVVTYWLYFAHFFFFTTLAVRTGRTSLGSLYLWGMLFGLYESCLDAPGIPPDRGRLGARLPGTVDVRPPPEGDAAVVAVVIRTGRLVWTNCMDAFTAVKLECRPWPVRGFVPVRLPPAGRPTREAPLSIKLRADPKRE